MMRSDSFACREVLPIFQHLWQFRDFLPCPGASKSQPLRTGSVPVNCRLRYSVRRFTFFVLLLALVGGWGQISAQKPAPTTAPTAAEAQPVSAEVAAAEEAITKSDWKAAETRLDVWLAAHPEDARALFDAGYVADAQNRLEAAAGLLPASGGSEPAIV